MRQKANSVLINRALQNKDKTDLINMFFSVTNETPNCKKERAAKRKS